MNKIRFAFVAACMAVMPLAGAAGTEVWSDSNFTFKFVKPPKPGALPRTLVQIDPEAQIKPQRQEPAIVVLEEDGASKGPVSKSSYSWFWNEVPPGIEADPAVRMQLARQRLSDTSDGNGVRSPRTETIHNIVKAHGASILKETSGTRISPALVLAVIAVESAGRTDAVSSAGAQGLMQLMPATAKRFGVSNSLAAAQNIKGGVAYLDWLLNEFNGDAMLALAGYNAGEGAVKKHAGVPPYEETRGYVPKVLAAFEVAKIMCMTQPKLVTDTCALNLDLAQK